MVSLVLVTAIIVGVIVFPCLTDTPTKTETPSSEINSAMVVESDTADVSSAKQL